MKLKDILAISGKGGLFKFISQARNGIIVESYTDGKRMAVHSNAKVSALEDIAIFTPTGEVPLGEVFEKIYAKESGKVTIDPKSTPEELKKFLESILPDYDKERVYVSDMKKLVQWYNQLIGLDLLKPGEEEEENKDEPQNDAEAKPETREKKPASKTHIKKATAKPTAKKPSSAAKSKTTATKSTKSK